MKHAYLPVPKPATQRRTEEFTDVEKRRAQRVQAIRARADRLYLRGDMAQAARLLMELESRKT